ncbi:MAG TPA: DnaA/Hda family protein [Pirellulales bacterium]|nr:DnaA/Hda family protein [Pirellulales bacterium]
MEDGVFIIPLSADLAPADVDAPPAEPARECAASARRDRAASPVRKAKSPATAGAVAMSLGNRPSASPISLEFIAGPENRLAAVAIESLLQDRPSKFNPLVIVGLPGVGKSHLARGLADRWASHHRLPPASVAYFNASDFAQELNAVIAAESTPAFQRRIRNVSLLVIEGLAQLQNRRAAQLELVHSLDAIVDQGGQVVITSSTPPERITGLSPDLRGRLAAGLLLPLRAPTLATRLAIVERLARLRAIPITAPALRALADGLNGTVPELLGALVELDVRSELTLGSEPRDEAVANSGSVANENIACAIVASEIAPRCVDAKAVRQWLADRRLRLQPTLRTISVLAAKYFGLRVAELSSPSRQRTVVQARAIAMYLGRQLTAKSLQQLGQHFGGRDHTTVLHNYRSIESRLQSDPATRRAVSDLRRALAHT